MDQQSLPTTKDILGEHLFGKVSLLEPNHAEHITGVLLGASNEDILLMLEDRAYLQSQIGGVKRVLRMQDNTEPKTLSSYVNPKMEKVAEELFVKVRDFTEDNAAKITGMILELDSTSVEHLLESPEDLTDAIDKAMKALNDSDHQHKAEKSLLAEELYLKVEQRQPDMASEITGMLLEMDTSSLQKLLSEPVLLDCKVAEAAAALKRT
ncbi:hypothetical protein BSL78_17470 [Apostichopus japonicus]|uniref:PABC domain-containing protein n=1 Tax=Stichopus japonicus TaxID=307972 RepID=A0A2G8KCG5_STIJA|nr:hypothetical protein BSL78_17470 [Apostichopus japonicus]